VPYHGLREQGERNDDAPVISKDALKEELVRRVVADLAALEDAQRTTREGATHEEAKPENDKDTRAVELSYLARGQAVRVDEARAAAEAVRAMSIAPCARVAVGAVVETEEESGEKAVFLAPGGGGTVLADGTIHVITPKSPLGKALLGKSAGDVVEAVIGGRTRELAVVRVR